MSKSKTRQTSDGQQSLFDTETFPIAAATARTVISKPASPDAYRPAAVAPAGRASKSQPSTKRVAAFRQRLAAGGNRRFELMLTEVQLAQLRAQARTQKKNTAAYASGLLVDALSRAITAEQNSQTEAHRV